MIKRTFNGANILPPGGTPTVLLGKNGRRLKKNCPCPKCHVWRMERAAAKMHLCIAEAITVSFEIAGPQSLPKDDGFLMIGGKK